MAEMEEPNKRCGKYWWKWKDLTGRRRKESGKAKEGEQGAVAFLVLNLAKAFRASQPPRGVGLGNALQLLKEDLASVVRILRAPEASAVRRMCGGALPDHFARVKVELLASAHCVAGCAESEATKFTLRWSWEYLWTTSQRSWWENKEVAEMAKKVTKKLKEKVERKGLQLWGTEHGKRRKGQDDCVVCFLGGRAASMPQGGRNDDGRQCGNMQKLPTKWVPFWQRIIFEITKQWNVYARTQSWLQRVILSSDAWT